MVMKNITVFSESCFCGTEEKHEQPQD